jgi:hypothetical protein
VLVIILDCAGISHPPLPPWRCWIPLQTQKGVTRQKVVRTLLDQIVGLVEME